jgi:ribonuclease J
MGQLFELAKKLDKKVALAGRTMDQNVRLGQEIGYLKGASNLVIPMDAIDDYPRNKVIVLSTGSQGEHRSALVRISLGEHPLIQLEQGDLVIMSSKFIPGNEKAIGKMIIHLFKQGAEVLYESVNEIHVSGHATKPELKQMLEAVKPRFFMPIHGEYRHLVHHAKLAKETGLKEEDILIAVNGDIVELDDEGLGIVHHMEEHRVLVEGRDGSDISKLVLKDRRQIGEKGIVFSLMVRNAESRRIISGPEIIARGLAHEDKESELLHDAKKVAQRVIRDYEKEVAAGTFNMDLQEEIRVQLRRFFNNEIGRKPVVLPIILDL